MNRYIAQKADQALEAMCGDGVLTERLKAAKMHFIIGSGYHIETAPESVRKSVTEFLNCDVENNPQSGSHLVRHAITSSLEEFARQPDLE